MSDHISESQAPATPGVVLAASFETPNPAMTERCLAAMQAFVARAGGGPVAGAESGLEQGVIAGFEDALHAGRCAVRASVEIRKLSRQQGDNDIFGLRIGVAAGGNAPSDAKRLRDAAAPGEILAARDIVPAMEGRLDVEKVDISGRRDAEGLPIDAYALTPTLTGQVFRYMPWTSPRRRLIGLLVAAALIAIALLGRLFQ